MTPFPVILLAILPALCQRQGEHLGFKVPKTFVSSEPQPFAHLDNTLSNASPEDVQMADCRESIKREQDNAIQAMTKVSRCLAEKRTEIQRLERCQGDYTFLEGKHSSLKTTITQKEDTIQAKISAYNSKNQELQDLQSSFDGLEFQKEQCDTNGRDCRRNLVLREETVNKCVSDLTDCHRDLLKPCSDSVCKTNLKQTNELLSSCQTSLIEQQKSTAHCVETRISADLLAACEVQTSEAQASCDESIRLFNETIATMKFEYNNVSSNLQDQLTQLKVCKAELTDSTDLHKSCLTNHQSSVNHCETRLQTTSDLLQACQAQSSTVRTERTTFKRSVPTAPEKTETAIESPQPRRGHHAFQQLSHLMFTYNSGKWFEPHTSSPIFFRQIGQVIGSLDMVHLVLNFDILNVITLITSTCAKLSDIKRKAKAKANSATPEHEHFYEELQKALKQLCLESLYSLEEVKHVFSDGDLAQSQRDFINKLRPANHFYPGPVNPYNNQDVSHSRIKRQFGEFAVPLAFLAGAGIAWAASHLFSSQGLVNIAAGTGTSPVAMRTFQDHETRLTVAERSLSILKNTTDDILANMSNQEEDIQNINVILKLIVVILDVQHEVDRLIAGLLLFHQHRLSPQLVEAFVLKDVINEMQLRLTPKMKMALNNVEEIYRLDTSHISYVNGTLQFFVHVPCFRPDSIMNLYEFVPTPLQLKDDQFLIPHSDYNYLAVNEGQNLFRELTLDDLALCHELNKVKYCKKGNFYASSNEDTCLTSLWHNDNEKVIKHCSFNFKKLEDHISQVSHNEFLLFSKQTTRLQKECPLEHPSTESVTFKGLYQFTAAPGCRLSTDKFVMDGTIDIYSDPVQVKIKTLDLMQKLQHLNLPQLYPKLNDRSLSLIGSSKGLKIKNIEKELKSENEHELLVQIVVGSVSGAIFLVCIFLVIYCIYRYKKKNKTPDLTDATRNIELQELLSRSKRIEEAK